MDPIRWRTTLRTAGATATPLLAAAVLLPYVLACGVDVPINDDWDLLETSLAWHEQGIDLRRLLAPHNEHCLAISRLSTHTLLAATHGSFRTVLVVNALLAVAAVAVLGWFVRGWPLPAAPLAALLAALALLITGWCQWQNWLWSFQTPWLLLPLLVTCGGVAVARIRAPIAAAAVAGGLAVAAVFCQANGLLVGPALLPAVVLRLRTEPRRVACVAAAVFAALAITGVVLGMLLLGPSPAAAARASVSLWQSAACVLAVLGSPLDPQGTFAGRLTWATVCGGIALVVGSIAAVVGVLGSAARGRELGPALALMAYGLGSVAAVAVGRLALITAGGVESRYQTFAVSWHVGTLLALGWLAADAGLQDAPSAMRPCRSGSRSGWQWPLLATSVACVVATLAAMPLFLSHGRNMRAALEGHRLIYAAVDRPGGREALAKIAGHYGPDRLARNLDRMKRAGLLSR